MKCLRVRYTKRGKIRFIGHRDVARIWERTLRKANIPVLYSQGFSPHPRISFGLALPTGFESEAEYVDIHLGEEFFTKDFDAMLIRQEIDRALPTGHLDTDSTNTCIPDTNNVAHCELPVDYNHVSVYSSLLFHFT